MPVLQLLELVDVLHSVQENGVFVFVGAQEGGVLLQSLLKTILSFYVLLCFCFWGLFCLLVEAFQPQLGIERGESEAGLHHVVVSGFGAHVEHLDLGPLQCRTALDSQDLSNWFKSRIQTINYV